MRTAVALAAMLAVAAACGPGLYENTDLVGGGCTPCAAGFYKSAAGSGGCEPCVQTARDAATCEGATTPDCLCADAPAPNAGIAHALCAGQYVPCPHTFDALFAFLRANATQCFNIIQSTAVRESVEANRVEYWFVEDVLCAPDATQAVEVVGDTAHALYRRRTVCHAGNFSTVRSDRADTECTPCPPGTFLGGGEVRGACYAKTRTCSGAAYDVEPVDTRTSDTVCVDEVLASEGLIPSLQPAGAQQFAFGAARRASLYSALDMDFLRKYCSSNSFLHSSAVLLDLWEHAGLLLPPVNRSIEGMPSSAASSAPRSRCLRACDAGYEMRDDRGACVKCLRGTAKSAAGKLAVEVLDGEADSAFALGPGKSYRHVPCAACAAGTFAASEGQHTCAECAAGFYCPAGATKQLACEGLRRAPEPGSGCDPARDYLPGECLPGATRPNCARCPFNATQHENMWEAYGMRAHCRILCSNHTRLRADWKHYAHAPERLCVPCERERPCEGRCLAGWRVHAGVCKRCTGDVTTLLEACPGAGPDVFVDTLCLDGVAAVCRQCPAPRGMRAFRNASDTSRCSAPECDTRVGPGGFSFVDRATARALLAFGKTSALPGDACIRTRIRARAECVREFAHYDTAAGAIDCAPPPPCLPTSFRDLVYSNVSQGAVCVCTPGFYETPSGQCAVCPVGMTSLAGTRNASGCFCRPGHARFGALQCLPCASVGAQPRRQYCPGGYASYASEVAPYRHDGLVNENSALACAFGRDPVHHGVCLCVDNSSVPAGVQHASAASDCELDANVYVNAEGRAQRCPPVPLARHVRAFGRVCATQCVEHAQQAPGGLCQCAPGFVEYGDACVCEAGTHLVRGACAACPLGFYCRRGLRPEPCEEDKTSLPNATAVTDCRCRAGWFWSNANRNTRCLPCQSFKYCQPECFSITPATFGSCTCPHGFLCRQSEPTQPRPCPQGQHANELLQQCIEGSGLRLWHNGLVPSPEPGQGLQAVNPRLAVLLPTGSQYATPVRGMYVLADAAWRCAAHEVLVSEGTARAFGNITAYACRALGVRVNTAHAVPSMLYANKRADRALVHELYPTERLRALSTVAGHLAWNQVLACAGRASTGSPGVQSELDACHACGEHRVALARTGLDRSGRVGSSDVVVALEPGVHAVWGLPDAHTCVGATSLRPTRALAFAVHCMPAHAAAHTHLNALGEYTHTSAAERVWTSFVVAQWQHTPARAHGARVVLSVLCFAEARAALAVHDVSVSMWYVQLLFLTAPPDHLCVGARPAHAVDRQAQKLYLATQASVLRVDLDNVNVDTSARTAAVVLEVPRATTSTAATAWVTNVLYASTALQAARDARLVVLRAVSRGGLRMHTMQAGVNDTRVLTRDGDIEAALARDLAALPVPGMWSPFAGTRFTLRHVASLNSARARHEHADAALPLDVLAHGELVQGSAGRNLSAAADVLLRFDASGVLASARLVHVLPFGPPALDVFYQWVPRSAHLQHANVLLVDGRVVAVHADDASPELTWSVAEFACASCREYERWDPARRECVCASGSAALCVPCVTPFGCDVHRTVYNTSAAACLPVQSSGEQHSNTHERRCAPCGLGGGFFCPTPTQLEACPADRNVSLTADGLAASSAACVCAQGSRPHSVRRVCAACAPNEVCTPELIVRNQRLQCPRRNTVLVRHPGVEACVCAPGWHNTSAPRVFARAHERAWPRLADVQKHALGSTAAQSSVRIEIAECRPCPPGQKCLHGRVLPCPPGQVCLGGTSCQDGFAPDAEHGGDACVACDALSTRVVCWNGSRYNCTQDDPLPTAAAPARYCPCADGADGAVRVWTHAQGCRVCRAHHYCAQTPPVHGHHTETPCPRHARSPPGSRDLRACECVAGRYMHAVISTNPLDAASNASCVVCPRDHFCIDGKKHTCPAGTTSQPGANAEHACVCVDASMELVAHRCRCRAGLRNVSGACVGCANPRAERLQASDHAECSACQPGFWRTVSTHVHGVLHDVHTGLAATHPFAHEFQLAWAQFQRVYANMTAARAQFCALCPPGFTCAGGLAAPVAFPSAVVGAVFGAVPAGADPSAAALSPCPTQLPPGARATATYGLSSCFQEATTWQTAQETPAAAAFVLPGVVRVDPREHRPTLVSAVLNGDRGEIATLLDFVDTDARAPAVRRSASGEYEFVFEVDVIRLAYAYRDDLVAMSAAPPDDDAGVWAAALLPAVWTVHNRARLGGHGAVDFVLPHLLENAHARAIVAQVAASAALRLHAPEPLPQPRFLATLQAFGLLETSQTLLQRGGMVYVWAGAADALFAAPYRAHHTRMPPPGAAPPAPLLAGYATPSVLVQCPASTRSVALAFGSVGARVCRACPHAQFLHAGACAPCTGVYEPLVCAEQPPRASRSAVPCAWARDNGCSVCSACTGCAYAPAVLAQVTLDFAANGLYDPLNSEPVPESFDAGACPA